MTALGAGAAGNIMAWRNGGSNNIALAACMAATWRENTGISVADAATSIK